VYIDDSRGQELATHISAFGLVGTGRDLNDDAGFHDYGTFHRPIRENQDCVGENLARHLAFCGWFAGTKQDIHRER
jgi:hypothetical protein